MSVYTKPLSQLTFSDLQELLDASAVENLRLEFKREVPDKDNTLKKISSFANTFGGFIVVGASADNNGRIQELVGVDKQPSYKQTVVSWCFDSVYPPITVDVSDAIPVPSMNARFCYVISVPESDSAPHFLNGRKGIWIRTNEFSARFDAQLANEDELQNLLARRRVIVERREHILKRARARFDRYLGRMDRARPLPGAYLEFFIAPRFPSQQLCGQEQLARLIQKSWASRRGTMFPNPSSPIVTQHESAIVLDAMSDSSISMFEINLWGLLFYGMRLDDKENRFEGILLAQFIGAVLLFIEHGGKLLREIGYVGPVAVETILGSILKMPWRYFRHSFLDQSTHAGSELDNDVVLSIPTSTDALLQKPDGIVAEIIRQVLFSINAPGLVDSQQNIESLVFQGYNYND